MYTMKRTWALIQYATQQKPKLHYDLSIIFTMFSNSIDHLSEEELDGLYHYLDSHLEWYQQQYPNVTPIELNTEYIQHDFLNRLSDRERREYALRANDPRNHPTPEFPPPSVTGVFAGGGVETQPSQTSTPGNDDPESSTGISSSRVGIAYRTRAGRGRGQTSSAQSANTFAAQHFAELRVSPRERNPAANILGVAQELRDRIAELTTQAGQDLVNELLHLVNAESMEEHLRTYWRNPLLYVPGLRTSLTYIDREDYQITRERRLAGPARPTIYIQVQPGIRASWLLYRVGKNSIHSAKKEDFGVWSAWMTSYRIQIEDGENIHIRSLASTEREERWGLVQPGQAPTINWRGWIQPGIEVAGARSTIRLGSFPLAPERELLDAMLQSPQDVMRLRPELRPLPGLHRMEVLRFLVEVSDGWSWQAGISDDYLRPVIDMLYGLERQRWGVRSTLREITIAYVVRGVQDDWLLNQVGRLESRLCNSLRDELENMRRDSLLPGNTNFNRGYGGMLDELRRVNVHIHVRGSSWFREFETSDTPGHWELAFEGGVFPPIVTPGQDENNTEEESDNDFEMNEEVEQERENEDKSDTAEEENPGGEVAAPEPVEEEDVVVRRSLRLRKRRRLN
jgi:hypothetical protein